MGRWQALMLTGFVLAIAAAGCGGSSGDTTTDATESSSELTPVEVPLTKGVVKRCMEQGGATGFSIKEAGAGALEVPIIGGDGPSGAPMGIALTKDPKVTEKLGSSLAAQGYHTQTTADGQAIVITDPESTDEDTELAEACLDPELEG